MPIVGCRCIVGAKHSQWYIQTSLIAVDECFALIPYTSVSVYVSFGASDGAVRDAALDSLEISAST